MTPYHATSPLQECNNKIPLSTLLHRIADEQHRLAAIVLALQDLMSPQPATVALGSETIRGLQSVDLVTQSLNDLARLTHAAAACLRNEGLSPAVSGPAVGGDQVRSGGRGEVGDEAEHDAEGLRSADSLRATAPGVSALTGMVDISTLKEVLTLGDLAARILGRGTLFDEGDSDVFWLGELAASDRQEGAA